MIEKIVIARKTHKKMGARSLYHNLKITEMGVNRFEQFISDNGLSVKRTKKRIITTHGQYEEHDKNLINGLVLNNVNQVIAGDITYFILDDKTYYIFTLKDMYSKRIVGLYGSENMLALNAIIVLKQALKLRGKNIADCIHHSDAGKQYKSNAYKDLLNTNGLVMSIAGNCLQNGMAEQLNGVLKNDYLDRDIKNVKILNRRLKKIMQLINYERPVAALNYMTPVEFEASLGENNMNKKIKLYDFEAAEAKRMRDFLEAYDNKKS